MGHQTFAKDEFPKVFVLSQENRVRRDRCL